MADMGIEKPAGKQAGGLKNHKRDRVKRRGSAGCRLIRRCRRCRFCGRFVAGAERAARTTLSLCLTFGFAASRSTGCKAERARKPGNLGFDEGRRVNRRLFGCRRISTWCRLEARPFISPAFAARETLAGILALLAVGALPVV
jgi:hypothetical protein